jgi:CSLREA domain-containing protein
MGRTLTILFAAAVLAAGVAEAAVIVVDTTADELNNDGDCSLREAVAATNSNSAVDGCPAGNVSQDSILIPIGGTISLTMGPLQITGLVTILGAGADTLTIDGGYQRIFEVDMTSDSSDFTLQQLRLRHGDAGSGDGGALWLGNVDHVTINDVVFDANTATRGGAIGFTDEPGVLFNELSIRQCLFSDNSASAAAGGAIGLEKSSTGTIRAFDQIEVSETQFTSNSAALVGGALYVIAGGDVILDRCAFIGNQAILGSGGAVNTSGTATVGPVLVVKNSFFAANQAAGTGGVLSLYSMGLFMVHTTVVRNSSLGDESVGAIFAIPLSGAVQHVSHTVVADSLVGPDCYMPAIDSFGYNLDSDGSCPFDLASDLQNADPLVGGVIDPGGWTLTAWPAAGSPVIDSGNPAGALDENGAVIVEDQLSNLRPVNGDGTGSPDYDRGSIEVCCAWEGLFFDGFEEGSTAAW